MPKDYAKTLNLPKTDFSMRANLPQREPATEQKWMQEDIYKKMLEKNEGHESFVLHDGPPFSNGNIHMGTAMNKVLKDFINKSKSMAGYYTPYIPGWDNHGMPIESAIIKQNKLDRKKMSVSEFRSACHAFAQKFVDIQMTSFKRLGVLGDWENPYLTMAPSFEAEEVKVFGEMYKKGYIYKGLKPVYWCPSDETALAEAEIEYAEDKCKSIYVKFRVTDDKGLFTGLSDLDKTYFIIWTTTTWTLPGNVAIAVHPREKYALIKASNGEYYVTAEALAEKTMKAGGVESFEIVKTFAGEELEYAKTKHPFLDRESVVVNADYVTMESGTGCVHTAPGYGVDDYFTGVKYKLEILVAVDDKGYQTEKAGKFAGLKYDESNEAIFDDMKQSGALFAYEEISHQYPHCWRCKNPIIFRATPQWFCSVDAFRNEAVKACKDVEWLPEWGENRIISMVNERADWCISRQRQWGLPIPVFYCEDCGKPVCTDETINKVSEIFAQKGSNAWFDLEAAELLPDGFVCPHCGGKHFYKEKDTLDGWFDSGSSHRAVIKNIKWPCDLYLEGADQYRGWFQSSLLTAVGATGKGAPYRQVLTHGWVVDGEGKAMHKSLGNSVYPEDVIKVYGADLLRLWVASSDYRVDVRVSDDIFKQLSEIYRKIRNTTRILLANLGNPAEDFDPAKDCVPFEQMEEIDKWIVAKFNDLVKRVKDAYNSYEFHLIYHDMHNFCAIELSKLYIDISKDRVYVQSKNSPLRRSAQTAMYYILSGFTRLIAPILSFTAEEIWQFMPHTANDNAESVFLNYMPGYREDLAFAETAAKYDKLFDVRDDVMKALELARAEKKIGKSLDAKVVIYDKKDSELMKLFESFGDELSDIFICSGVELTDAAPDAEAYADTLSGIAVKVVPAVGTKCDRCWFIREDVSEDGEGGHICKRCASIVNADFPSL